MCQSNCCCRNTSKKGLIYYLMVFIIITFVLSFISIFIRAGKTKRYKQALILLEERNNGSFDYPDTNCRKGGYIFKDETYCEYDGVMLKKPETNVSHQSLFKKWKTIELIINISRTVITGIFCIYLYMIVRPKLIQYIEKGETNTNSNDENNNNFWTILNVCLAFLILVSSLCILIRAFAISTNQGIALYEETSQNQFDEYIAINYILDIAIIVLTSIAICFVNRIKREVKPIVVVAPVIQEPQPPPVINRVFVKREIKVQINEQNIISAHPLDI